MTKTLKYLLSGFFLLTLMTSQSGILYSQAKPCYDEQKVPPFPAVPSTPAASDELRFIAVGDTGRGCDAGDRYDFEDSPQCAVSNEMIKLQKRTGFNLFLFLGDNVYDFGNPSGFFRKLYDPYRTLAESGVLFKGVLGNHDLYSNRGTRLQMKFFRAPSDEQKTFFTKPIKEQLDALPDSGRPETYYSFVMNNGLVEFFALDSSVLADDCPKHFFWKRNQCTDEVKEAHLDWLKKALAKSEAKWRIIFLHHSPYSSAAYHGVTHVDDQGREIPEKIPGEMQILRRLEADLAKIKEFHLVLSGHDHFYEHIELPKGSIPHFVAGGGSKLRKNDFQTKGREPAARLPAFHLCGESELNSFMFFSVTPKEIRFWTIGVGVKNDRSIFGEPFDYGVIQ